MKKITLLLFSLALLASCASQFNQEEKKIIYNNPQQPARVLTIYNKKDSLVLYTPSKDIRKLKDNPVLTSLIEKLKITMKAESGVGIAAPQIGINKNIFLFLRLDKPGTPVQVAINPKIISHPEETFCFENDGCLSVPGKYGNSKRYAWVEVEYTDENGKTFKEKLNGGSRQEDYTGIVFQHEYDHLQGILYINKLCK